MKEGGKGNQSAENYGTIHYDMNGVRNINLINSDLSVFCSCVVFVFVHLSMFSGLLCSLK